MTNMEKMKIKLFFSIFIIGVAQVLFAQSADSVIQTTENTDGIKFSIPLRELTQIPGAPKPFYTYFWDFGDGHFSTEASPTHTYKDNGIYDCSFYAVNNYDDGKKPTIKKKKIEVKNASYQAFRPSVDEKDFFKANGIFEMRYNCMAMPNDTMLLTIGLKNKESIDAGGKLFLMLNEKLYSQTCFDTTSIRLYNTGKMVLNENPMEQMLAINNLEVTESGSPASHTVLNFSSSTASSAFQQALQMYKSIYTIDLDNLEANESKFSFVELHVTPEMVKDTNATLVMTGVYVPPSGKAVMHKLNIPVVNSHDPNKMNLKGGPLAYRFIKKHQEFNYKVRFQNTGEGPARKVALDISLPREFDMTSIKITDMHPYCPPCDSLAGITTGCWELKRNDDGALFTFKGIYLKGTNQKGVQDKDSTKGFMEFGVHSLKRLDKKPFRARTAIYFDKNEPVITNNATGRFLPGISPLITVGFEHHSSANRKSSGNGLVAGFGLAPLAPRLPYFQFELFYKKGMKTTVENIHVDKDGFIFIKETRKDFIYDGYDSVLTKNIDQIKLVPLHFRYNLNKYFGIGAGALMSADLGGEETLSNYYHQKSQTAASKYLISKTEKIKFMSNYRFQPFIDVQLGLVKWGPHLGARYYPGTNKNSFTYFYAGWRF